MLAGAHRFGAESLLAEVTALSLDSPVKTVSTTEGEFKSRTVIISTGADPKNLGLPGEAALLGRGVSHCAACDGMFYRGKTVVIVGGGNTAAADALQLSRICKKVILIHRRDTLRATKVYHQPLLNAPNVEFRWNSAVTELLHNGRLTGVKVQNLHSGEEETIECDGLFVSIGRSPNSWLVRGQLELDNAGYIVADETTGTSLPGVYAVGDVRTKVLRQVITAASDGAVAAHYAEEYLASLS
jgi:thioredoxin reductase (NADPH)